MRCFACSGLLPIEISTLYDTKTDRFYCPLCQQEIKGLHTEMYGKPKTPEDEDQKDTDLLLDEDFDNEDFYIEPNDFLDVPLDEEELVDYNLLPENYDE